MFRISGHKMSLLNFSQMLTLCSSFSEGRIVWTVSEIIERNMCLRMLKYFDYLVFLLNIGFKFSTDPVPRVQSLLDNRQKMLH